MRMRRLGRSLEVSVVLAFDGRNVKGRTGSASTKGLFVEAQERLPEPGSRVLVRFPVRKLEGPSSIIIVGEVQKTMRGPDGKSWGTSLSIVTVNEGDDPGIYRRHIESV